jgi:hypothetical protein
MSHVNAIVAVSARVSSDRCLLTIRFFLRGQRPTTDRPIPSVHPQTSNRSHNGNASCEHQYHRLINQHHLIIRDLVARSFADPRAKAATSLSATSHNNNSHLPLPTTHTQQPFRNRTFADTHLQSRPRRTTVSLTAARANCIVDNDGRQPVWHRQKLPFAPPSTHLPPFAQQQLTSLRAPSPCHQTSCQH